MRSVTHVLLFFLLVEGLAMPACARAEIVRDGEVAVYHVYTRCVRRAFLCGDDPLTGKNYDFRRDWIRDLQGQLARLFGLDIAFRAEMSNHLHIVLRSRPDVVATWSDEDVARRWLTISRLVHSQDGQTIRPIAAEEIEAELAKPDRVEQLRRRLASVSQFMKALCEHISRRANREDGTRGAFFESRFKCKHLAGEGAILVCGMYVDLNQIRGGEASTPEESTHTSAHDRIQEFLGRQRRDRSCTASANAACQSAAPETWLCELTLDERAGAYRGADRSQTPWRASDKGLLPIKLEEYLQLLDWTGRALVDGKKGVIPARLAPILDRLKINRHKWFALVSHFESLFSHVVGTAAQVAETAARAGRHWYHGRARCAEAFG